LLFIVLKQHKQRIILTKKWKKRLLLSFLLLEWKVLETFVDFGVDKEQITCYSVANEVRDWCSLTDV